MWIDILIAAILLYSIIQGFFHGFVQTFIHTLGWLISIVLAFACYPYAVDFLKNKTPLYDSVHQKIVEKFAEGADSASNSFLRLIPDIIRDFINNAIKTLSDAMAVSFADGVSTVMFNIIGFIAVIIAIKLLFGFIVKLFSKKSNKGIIGFIDSFFGILAGALKGIIIVYILLALMVPVSAMTDSEFFLDSLDQSNVAGYMYDNNYVLYFLDYFSQ